MTQPARTGLNYALIRSRAAETGLTGRSLTAAHRHGKTIWLETSGTGDEAAPGGPELGIHLGMSGRIVVTARDKSWGGYSGYFADRDGYLWEVLYSDQLKFNPDGSVVAEE